MVAPLPLLVIIAVLVLLLLKLKPYLYHEKITTESFTSSECKKFKTVAIVGGSMAGLMAAKTISSFAETVVLLEQKQFKESEPTAPQASHLHVLLKRGLNILNKMFPGFAQELRSKGAQPLNWLTSMKWVAVGGERFMSDHKNDTYESLMLTRVFLDDQVRTRLAKESNIKRIDDATVHELKLDPSNPQKVVGLKYKNTYGDESTIDCDLLIDCSGHMGSIGSLLKKQMGVEVPTCKIKTFLTYSTVIVEKKKKDTEVIGKTEQGKEYSNLYYSNFPPNLKALAMLKTEVPFQHILTTVACNKLKNTTSFEGYAEFAKGTAFEKEIQNILENYEPVTPVKTINKEGSVYRFYDQVSVQGYIALGDSISSFNPIYGQGVASAAQHCLILDTMLRNNTFSEKSFHARVRQACTVPWMLGAVPDMAYPLTETENIPIAEKLMVVPALWFMKGFMKCCVRDEQAVAAFYYLLHLQQDHLLMMLNPILLLKVFYAAIMY